MACPLPAPLRYGLSAMLDVLLAALWSCQDPERKPAPAQPVEASAIRVTAWDDATAKAAIEQFTKAFKGSPNLAQRTAALEQLAPGSNSLLVKPLVRIVETDKAVTIQKRAVELLANQPADIANAAIRRLLKQPRVAESPPVLAEVVRSMGRCGYSSAQWTSIEDLFEKSYEPARMPLQIAILELVAAHKEVAAVPLLLRNLDEPVPANVDDPLNPPAEYWKARWTAWSAWCARVKDALYAITGQRFTTVAEAKAWLAKNPLK
jgi:hypothetical protein